MKHVVNFPAGQPQKTTAELRIGIRSAPYLADHGFQDMTVLPGAFYIDLALCMHREPALPVQVRKVNFHNPVILSADDAVLKVDVRAQGDTRVEYAFYEAGGEEGGARPYAARLEIERSPSAFAETEAFSIEEFQARSRVVIDSDRFYKTLRENGNHYGPRFQNVAMIWRAGDESLGKILVARQHREVEPHYLHPSLLDSMAQLLAPFIMEEGKTFILRSIENIKVLDVAFPDTLWAHATRLTPGDGDGQGSLSNVRIFDESGKAYLELSGVAFSLLDPIDLAEEKQAANLVIAGNFTAEPLEDALGFWGDHFGVSTRVEFAPYNQIFQQLLDSDSAFCRNRDGANIILLELGEWAGKHRPPALQLNQERSKQCFGDRPRYILPNGMEIVHLNQYETDYVYKEVFEDECYLRHGIRLPSEATVVDIGANIGLFSLFVMSRCENPRIYAFEPAPVVYDLLKANCEAYSSNVRALNLGVSDKSKTATFTFYERSSVFSGFHSDEAEDREAIQTVVRNMVTSELVGGESVEDYVNELTADRLNRRTCECRLTSVSNIIREQQIARIDLLKIDAEKSELDILQGIENGDWPKIEQIVMEIHDRTGEAVRRIEKLLMERGYHCAVEEETLLKHSGLFNLYATRSQSGEAIRSNSEVLMDVAAGTSQGRCIPERRPPARHPSASTANCAGSETGAPPVVGRGSRACRDASGQPLRESGSLQQNVRDFCAALRSFTNQSTVPLILCFCPRTPGAATDAALMSALNEAEETMSSESGAIANVHTIRSAALLRHYPVADIYDPHSHQLGHIPYTPECYAAIGTELFRALFNLKGNPFKVIVLDCDNTLWKGVCGEDGPAGIELTAPYRDLQEFMIGRMNSGMLLSLCSKNNEKDVLDVFEQRTDMPLKREHLVSWRINWNSKSENIKSLANELNLGLDSFIFIDDNPVECADVKINCPGVLTLQLPRNIESFPAFLNHIWAFDHIRSTEEDRNRTRLYRENTERQQFRERSFSLKDFVKGLELRVEIAEATEEQLGRVSQLMFRTNQFNFTTIRRSEMEIKEFLRREGANCLVVRVVDRFGDYGLVGVVMFETEADRYKVDTFLLSCRVLGRGVEHAVVSHLGRRAVKVGKQFVELTCRPTQKNLPALEFINRIGDPYRNESGASWTFPAEHIANLEYDPDEKASIAQKTSAGGNPEKPAPRPAWAFGDVDRSERLQRIGENLCDIDRLSKAIEEFRLGKQAFNPAADVAPGNTMEGALLNIWRRVLGRPRIGMNDNFFEAGGTSLRAVQVIAMVRKELKQDLSIVNLFECPTVALLAAKLSAKPVETQVGATPAGAALRGQRRRHKTVRQPAS